jgi:hypothetical protein
MGNIDASIIKYILLENSRLRTALSVQQLIPQFSAL